MIGILRIQRSTKYLARGLSILVPAVAFAAVTANAASRSDDPAIQTPVEDASHYSSSRSLPEPGQENEFLPSDEVMESTRQLHAEQAISELRQAVSTFPYSIRLPQLEAGTTLDRASAKRQVLPDGSTFHTLDLRLTLPSGAPFHMWQAQDHDVLVKNGKPLLEDPAEDPVQLDDQSWQRLVHPDDPSQAIYNAGFSDGSVVTVDFPVAFALEGEALLASLQAATEKDLLELAPGDSSS
jgi:hypothetical protein